MKTLWLLIALFWVAVAFADDAIWLPNLPGDATGTKSGGKNLLDVNVAGGTFPITVASPLPVIISSPLPLPVVQGANGNGNTSVVTVTAAEGSMAAPANAVCLEFESESGNTINMRWGISNSATPILSSTVGQLWEPGRDSSPCIPVGFGSYIHYILVSAGSQPADITWVLTQ
jgi:hypothetical protein